MTIKKSNCKNKSVSKTMFSSLYKWHLLPASTALSWTDKTSIRRCNERLVKELYRTEPYCTSSSTLCPPKRKQEPIQSLYDGIYDAQVNSDCPLLVCTIYFLELAFHFQINHCNFQSLFNSSDFMNRKADG